MTASDPARSIWVSANAGSGKTHVLTQRVIRLLLAGTPPAKILCLTFTKAAAAQMAERVFATLSTWTTMDDSALRDAIRDTGAPDPRPRDLQVARRLFTRTVETPGGLKIQTIHAFCERLLHLFPFEANVPARFDVADDLRAAEMMAAAKRAAVAKAQRSGGEPGAALALVAEVAGSAGLDGVLAQAMKLRSAARRSGDDRQATLSVRLGLDAARTPAAVRGEMLRGGVVPREWPALADALEEGKATDRAQAARLRAAYASSQEGAAATVALDEYLGVFFGADGPRKILATKTIAERYPQVLALLIEEQARLVRLLNDLKIAEAVERTQALVHCADRVAAYYEHAKIVAGVLDFDDLIDRTLTLLERAGSAWVLHKLDAGIDHVLVDEAQDTSEAQWRILEHLTADFAAGAGARGADRSFFVVGDDKQSIFSFQGAAPLMFDAMRSSFERRFKAGGKPFERVALKTSFRSVPGILSAVDTLFSLAEHQDGLVRKPDIWPLHESIKSQLPGLVEVWPAVAPTTIPDPFDWKIPLDALSERDPPSIVAERVAQKIRMLLAPDSADRVHDGRGGERRPIRPGDILILVRTRGPFFEAVIRALKLQRVPVAGADRLDVARHIAVLDLVAAGRVALLPQDDLALAALLKSPLVGLNDDDLIRLAPGRTGALLDALAASAEASDRAIHATLLRWRARAAASTPFEFYIELLGREGGRRRMEARLGPEAHDAIDEFLRLALLHEQVGTPSLDRFLDEVEALDTTVKRDMEAPGDAVRVMTVHAAKGLEAKVVFLPDTCAVPAASLEPVVFDLEKDTGRPPILVWSPRKADDPPVVATARAAERQASMREYRRLLYVALTRAEERLYVCGFRGSRDVAADSWNAMVAAAFADAPEVPAFWDEADTVKRIETQASEAQGGGTVPVVEQGMLGLVPDWLGRPVAAPPRTGGRLRPTRRVLAEETTAARREALSRGALVHQLLQYCPGLVQAHRVEAGARFLAARAPDLPTGTRDAILAEALAVIAAPELSVLFGAGSRAEVAVHGRLAVSDGSVREVRGSVDRLVVTDDAIVIADFKTGTPSDEVPADYLEQVALYRQVLAPLWRDKPLRVLLVWTSAPRAVEISAAALDAAVAPILQGETRGRPSGRPASA